MKNRILVCRDVARYVSTVIARNANKPLKFPLAVTLCVW